MPIEYAIPKIHRFLTDEGVRDKICFIASGGIRNAMDAAKAIALGANGCVFGTAEVVALECLRCGKCESGRGCARGIATTDSELGQIITEEWAEQRLVNMYAAWRKQWCEILRQYGLRRIQDLVGRSDLLVNLDYLDEEERAKYQPAPEINVVI
jgi:glutamate synthase domain-containing protein 2